MALLAIGSGSGSQSEQIAVIDQAYRHLVRALDQEKPDVRAGIFWVHPGGQEPLELAVYGDGSYALGLREALGSPAVH